MGLFRKEPYETMTDQEFVDEMIRVFDIRLSLEHAISILRDQEKGIAASDWQPKFEQQSVAKSASDVVASDGVASDAVDKSISSDSISKKLSTLSSASE